MLFLRSAVTPRPTEHNTEDPDVSNIFAAPANEYDNENAEFQEEVEIHESDSESSQSFQLNASCNQSVAIFVTNETCDETRNTKSYRGNYNSINSLPDAIGPIEAIASKNIKDTSPVNSEKELLDLETMKRSLLRGKSDEDEDMNFFKSLIPHVKQLPSINKLYFRSQVQNLLAHELSKIQSSLHMPPPATLCQLSPPTASPASPVPSPAVPYIVSHLSFSGDDYDTSAGHTTFI
jgi:hypothetical protein